MEEEGQSWSYRNIKKCGGERERLKVNPVNIRIVSLKGKRQEREREPETEREA